MTFICPVTKKPARSGPEGKGYRLVLPKDWLKKAAPVLAISLKVVQLAMTAYGIPLPTPPLPSGMTSNDFVGLLFEEIESELASGVEDAIGEAKEVMEAYQESYDSSKLAMEVCSEVETISKKDAKKLRRAVEDTEAEVSYKVIRGLLVKLEGGDASEPSWEPKHTGQRKVSSWKDGATAWVSKEGEAAFHEKGGEALL